MIKKTGLLLLAIILPALSVFALSDEIVFMEYGINYSSAFTPSEMENNDDGTYDTMAFDAKVGANLLRWGDIYAGGSFYFFDERKNDQQHYSFFPIYIGVRVNVFPEWIVYPDFNLEIGKAFSNRHTQVIIFPSPVPVDRDESWFGNYYNFGCGINFNVADIAVLSLRVERPSIMNDRTGAEIHLIKAGLAWKIFY